MVSNSAYCYFFKFPKLNFWGDIMAFASFKVSKYSAHFTRFPGEDLLDPGM